MTSLGTELHGACLLHVSAVGQGVDKVAHAPLVVRALAQGFNTNSRRPTLGPKDRIDKKILHSGSKAQHWGRLQKPWFAGSSCLCGLLGLYPWGLKHLAFEDTSLWLDINGTRIALKTIFLGGSRAFRRCALERRQLRSRCPVPPTALNIKKP